MSGFGDSLTTVGTTQLHPLGTTVVEPATQGGTRANQGEKSWIYVYNDEASNAFAEGLVVMRDSATTTYDAVLGDASGAVVPNIRILGVAQHAIAAGSYGFVLKQGVGEVQAGDTGNDQANDPLIVHGSGGQADVMAAGEEEGVFAFSTENAGTSAGDKMTCWINCAG